MAEIYEGVAIWDSTNPTTPYNTEVGLKESIKKRNPTIVLEPLNAEYPIVMHNSKQKYLSGTVTGNFADNQNTNCITEYDWTNLTFKLVFSEFLRNTKTKYLQLHENLIIPVAITNDISFDIEKTVDTGYNTTITFEWVQVDPIQTLTSPLITCTACNATLVPNAHYCHMCGIAVI